MKLFPRILKLSLYRIRRSLHAATCWPDLNLFTKETLAVFARKAKAHYTGRIPQRLDTDVNSAVTEQWQYTNEYNVHISVSVVTAVTLVCTAQRVNPIQTGGGGGGAFDATRDLNPLLLTDDCVYSVPTSWPFLKFTWEQFDVNRFW